MSAPTATQSDEKMTRAADVNGAPREFPTTGAEGRAQLASSSAPSHLTPHTHRLLRLLQQDEGASNSDAASAAATAVDRLVQLAPALSRWQAWELLGRLQALLRSRRWGARIRAAAALGGVARNCRALEEEAAAVEAEAGDRSLRPSSPNLPPIMTLTVDRIDLPRMLEDAQADQYLLLSRPVLERRDDDEGEQDDNYHDLPLEASVRLELQRRILIRRLGLSGVADVLEDNGAAAAASFVTDRDIVEEEDLPIDTANANATAAPEAPGRRRQPRVPRRGTKRRRGGDGGGRGNNDDDECSDSEEDLADDNTLRALLHAATSGTVAGAANRHPRSVLAADLLCRMVDPHWHVRHGAFLGALALLRNGWTTAAERGGWPEAVLTISLCVLALDRFGDYSGAAVQSSVAVRDGDDDATSSRIVAASVVAPVRELAGQVLAVTWVRAPAAVQERVLDRLFAMRRNADVWEVRHAALVAFKYVATVLWAPQTPADSQVDSRLDSIVRSAIDALRDECDDVKTVAAQLLIEYFRGETVPKANVKVDAIANVWKAVVVAESHSACLVDLVALLCSFAREDCGQLLRLVQEDYSAVDVPKTTAASSIVQTLTRLLDSEYTSVKVSVLRCIQNLAHPLASHCGAIGDSFSYNSFMVRVFESLFDDDAEALDTVVRARNMAWKELVQACPSAFAQSQEAWTTLAESLFSRFFGLRTRGRGSSGDSFDSQSKAADALTLFILAVEEAFPSLPIVVLALQSYLRSPWASQCEAACLLLSSWYMSGKNGKDRASRMISSDGWFRSVASVLQDWIAGNSWPACLPLDPHRSEAIRYALDDSATRRLCDDAFLRASSLVRDCDRSVSECSDSVVALWRRAVGARVGSESALPADSGASMHSVRLYASLAGAVLSTGVPPKLTPVIRSLMTSLKNETSPCRLGWTSRALCALLLAIEDVPRFCTAREKVLNALCSMSLSEESSGAHSSSASSRVLTLYLTRVTETKVIQDLGPVWHRITPLLANRVGVEHESILSAARFLRLVVSGIQPPPDDRLPTFCKTLLRNLIGYACEQEGLRRTCLDAIEEIHAKYRSLALGDIFSSLIPYLQDVRHRTGACVLFEKIVADSREAICSFVRALLPVAMSLMTDSSVDCARLANKTFGTLVRMAPLVDDDQTTVRIYGMTSTVDESVIDHLIGGKPLPFHSLSPMIENALSEAKLTLRPYQREGITWLLFLWSLNLNGALCDSMGLGKTLQALTAIAASHFESSSHPNCSLIVCPSTLVGHWETEIDKCFSKSRVFQPLCYVGNRSQRDSLWRSFRSTTNLVITSYSVLRSDVELLSKHNWHACVLDEGHLLRNAKTATAQASRRLSAKHRLILTGTPVQNRVHELWAVFDFLMPNFLGTSSSFAKEFERPITKGQASGAKTCLVADGIEKLRMLHQQVLPFILRREKDEVLRELPPKVMSYVKVPLSGIQRRLYNQVTSRSAVRSSLEKLKRSLSHSPQDNNEGLVDSTTLKSLLVLRLLCTHPALVCKSFQGGTDSKVEMSGKLMALLDMLRNSVVDDGDLTAADNDTSLLYCNDDAEETVVNDYEGILNPVDDVAGGPENFLRGESSSRKCIIFSQFTRSLDFVEDLVLKPFMSNVRYVRLDGRVAPNKRSGLANRFNSDPTIRLFLATTRVGGLGLNLTGADTVIFLENDYNPFVDLQAQDRAHRIGQLKCVNVYYLVSQGTIEEAIIDLQNKKLAVSEAIVNSDNSSMYSMGTDRLLDIFNSRSNLDERATCDEDSLVEVDELIDQNCEEYASLSVEEFLRGLVTHIDENRDDKVIE